MPTDKAPPAQRSPSRVKRRGAFALCLLVWPAIASAQETAPLSAIDWLSDIIAEPPQAAGEPGVADTAAVSDVEIQPLDVPQGEAFGLLPSSITKLPVDLWGAADSEHVLHAIRTIPRETLPALIDLQRRILLTETKAPQGAETSFLLARIDALLALGMLDDARAMIELTDLDSPELFGRWFDIGLLTGSEDLGCDQLRENGGFAPTYQARIFCLARNGDWNAAALTLNSAEGLGVIDGADYDLLARFLDPDLFEADPILPPPAHPTPLIYRIYEAIGEPISTRGLPLAFAHADLRPVAGWKPRIEAGERLMRAQAIHPSVLLGIYTERLPAASGGVWQRVNTFQQLDAAMAANDDASVSNALPVVYSALSEAELEPFLAALFIDELIEMNLSDEAAAIRFKLILLSDRYIETGQVEFSNAVDSGDLTDEEMESRQFLRALASGRPGEIRPPSPLAAAIRDGFDGAVVHLPHQRLLEEGRIGEALLHAAQDFHDGALGDLEKITRALRLFRHAGLEELARRAALEVMVLDRTS